MQYIWKNRKECEELAKECSLLIEKMEISSFLAHVLCMRDIEMAHVEEYLYPGLSKLHSKELWQGFENAAKIFAEALLSGKRCAVWGDYDVDGTTAAALVYDIVTQHGFSLECYIPHREEGYGVTKKGLEYLAAKGVNVILTVDCGISDVSSVSYAKELFMDIIITDHHTPPKELPNALAICNPKLYKTEGQDIAGVGVAFIFMAMVNTIIKVHTKKDVPMKDVLDLVALGSIADLVPLRGQNRVLVKNGLLLLKEAKRPGIQALKEVCGIKPTAEVSPGKVGFSLAPRINAAGRMSHAKEAWELLTSTTIDGAREIAKQLDALNKERQDECERILEEARIVAKEYSHARSLVLFGEEWHHGIIGIVASNIVEEFYKPTVILTRDHAFVKGSARSIAELNLYEALESCKDLFIRFGGHKAAAGMSMVEGNVGFFREKFERIVVSQIGEDALRPSLRIDGQYSFEFATQRTFQEDITCLQPFGMSNPEPIFASYPVCIKEIRHFGQYKNHVMLSLQDSKTGIRLKAKIWNKGQNFSSTDINKVMEIAYSPVIEEEKGLPQITVKIRDWRWLE
ncbi:MAG: single-stranded-DNA-specific exonuclease RecJ [Desulfovibrionaceae bacterium]